MIKNSTARTATVCLPTVALKRQASTTEDVQRMVITHMGSANKNQSSDAWTRRKVYTISATTVFALSSLGIETTADIFVMPLLKSKSG